MIDENNNNTMTAAVQEMVPQSEQPVVDKKEMNWRALEERAMKAEREKEELARYIASMQQKQTPQQSQEYPNALEGSDDDLIERKHLKHYAKQFQSEISKTKEELNATISRLQQEQVEQRLRRNYSDFDAVVTEDNIRKLAAAKPAVYRSLMANPDLYDKAELAYEAVRTWIETPQQKQVNERIQNNMNKPRTASSGQIAENPLTSVDNYDRRVLSEDRKAAIRSQVEQAKKGW